MENPFALSDTHRQFRASLRRFADERIAPNATAAGYWGGTSAFSVDNVSPDPQTTSIYFGTLNVSTVATTPCGTSNYCAVKLTQNGLQ